MIQKFFAQMTCNFCHEHFDPDGIALIREESGVHMVNVHCNACDKQNGIAMVGVQPADEDDDDNDDHFPTKPRPKSLVGKFASGLSRNQPKANKSGLTRVRIQISRVDEDDEDDIEDDTAFSDEAFARRFPDPELTPAELERLSDYPPIGYDDVLEAHQFFSTLDKNWQQFIPKSVPLVASSNDVEVVPVLSEEASTLNGYDI
jgi:hypothetical protein